MTGKFILAFISLGSQPRSSIADQQWYFVSWIDVEFNLGCFIYIKFAP